MCLLKVFIYWKVQIVIRNVIRNDKTIDTRLFDSKSGVYLCNVIYWHKLTEDDNSYKNEIKPLICRYFKGLWKLYVLWYAPICFSCRTLSNGTENISYVNEELWNIWGRCTMFPRLFNCFNFFESCRKLTYIDVLRIISINISGGYTIRLFPINLSQVSPWALVMLNLFIILA